MLGDSNALLRDAILANAAVVEVAVLAVVGAAVADAAATAAAFLVVPVAAQALAFLAPTTPTCLAVSACVHLCVPRLHRPCFFASLFGMN